MNTLKENSYKKDLSKNTCVDSIVLYAKQSGPTSFSSLNVIKHSLKTKKVGHTGTLDSFAQGLLVVCVGRLTRLAGNITEFDKEYKAVIKFGQETDTLEYTGEVIKSAELPELEKLKSAIVKFTGPQKQTPPNFSAIHVNGKRASDLSREGKTVEIPSRDVIVYNAELIDYRLNDKNLVEYCLINFAVSKGTYIRSLARDIAYECNSVAHLAGLYRTRVGNFRIEDAAGFNLLNDFSIDTVVKNIQNPAFLDSQLAFLKEKDDELKEEIRKKILSFDFETAKQCGFSILTLSDKIFKDAFKNGKKIHKNYFKEDINLIEGKLFSVFDTDENFYGLIERDDKNKFSYKFVIN